MESHESDSSEANKAFNDIYEKVKDEISQFKSCKEQEQKAYHFFQFLIKYDYLLIHSDQSESKKDTILDLYNFIFENIDFSLFSIQSSVETATVISKVNKIFISNDSLNTLPNGNPNTKISPYSIKMILKNCCSTCNNFPEIYKTFSPFLSSLFSKEDFFIKFVKSDLFEFILSNILFITPKYNYDVFLFDICFVFPKPSYFTSIPINSFTTFFVNSVNTNLIPDESREITAKFVATLVSKVANVSKGAIDLFGQLGGFDAYDKLISKFPEKERPNYYSIFMISNCEPSIIDHLLTLYQENPDDEQTYFEMFSQKLRTQSELINKCNIEKWFEMKEPKMNHLIPLFKFIYQSNPPSAAASLPYLLKSMLLIKLDFNIVDEVLNITQKLLNQSFLTLEQLAKMNFLNVFFFNTTQSAFLEIFSNQIDFQMFISIYNLLEEIDQNTFFSRFCQFISIIEKDKFISICTTLLTRSSTVENMKTLFSILDKNKDCSYISILLNSFLESETNNDYISEVCNDSSSDSASDYEFMNDSSQDFIKCQINFILAGGIDWIFNSPILSIRSIISLISHLVSYRSYEQLEKKIKSLDHFEHPLFSVDQESMLIMVFGLTPKIANIKQIDFYYLPIRIRSLFEYLDDKFDKLNPYNIFFLGKEFINSKLTTELDIYTVPYIHSFGNRCISPEHIEFLFDCPERLNEFCDESQDHFPFYMLFCDNCPLIFPVSLSTSSGLSFWFKVDQKTEEESKMNLLFQTDNGIKIYTFQKKVHLSIDTMKSNDMILGSVETEFDPTVWNHVFINVYSAYSLGSNISISINSNTIPIKVKKKFNQISNLFFINQNPNTILYLSNSICIYNNCQKFPNLINDIYSKGPSSILFNENSEIINPITQINNTNNYISATSTKRLFIKKKKEVEKFPFFDCHSEIYLVPYLGFPKHPISQILIYEKIKDCESYELYEKLFNTFLKMTELNPNLLVEYDILDLLRYSKQKPSYELFTNILKREISLSGPKKELLTEIVFDSTLWNVFDPAFIFKALFELFPISLWANDRTLVTFITHSLLTNSDKPDVAEIVVLHLVEIPSLMKYVSSLIKVAPVLSRLNPVWNQIEFRENSSTQEVLINSLIPIINKENYNFFKSYLPFNELKSLFIVSSDTLCSSIFALITKFSIVQMSINKENDYFEIDFVFLSKFVQLSHIKKVWESALEMHHLPSLLCLIWSSSIAFSYFYSNVGFVNNERMNNYPGSSIDTTTDVLDLQIERLIKNDINCVMAKSILYCIESSTKIMNDQTCLKIISILYPYIFTYPSLFKDFQNLNDVTQSDPIVLNVNQFSDIDDDLWIEKLYVLSRFNFPPSSNPFSYFSFLNQMISSVLRNFGFSLPFSFKTSNNLIQSSSTQTPYSDPNALDSLDLISWFSQSPLLDFFMSIISNCSVQFLDSFLYSIVSNDHYNPLLSTLMHGLLSRIPTNSIEKVLIILDYVSVLSSFQLLNQNAIILMADLFTVFNIVQIKFSERDASVVASRIQPVLISLLNLIPFSEIKMLFSLLSNNLKAFKFFIETTHSLHSWLYSFIAFSHNEIEVYNDFINKLRQAIKLDDYDRSIIDKISKRQIQKNVDDLKAIESEWKELTNNFRSFAQSQFHKIQEEKNKANKEIKQTSIDFNYFKYYSNVKHFLLSFFVCQNIRYFEVYSSLYKEELEWSSLMKKIKTKLYKFKPKYRMKTNFSWPYQTKRSESSAIKIQSVFNDLIIERNKVQTVKSEVIKTFKKTIKFQYVFINDIPLNLFNLFKENYGNPDNFTNCNMLLNKYEIPCVLFLYPKKIMIVTYATIQSTPGRSVLPGSSLPSTTSFSMSGDNNFIFKKEKDSFELNCFFQHVFCGNFGQIKLFASHILISINMDSLIYIQWIDKYRFKMWSILNGYFEFQLSQKINIKYKDTFSFNANPTKEELYQQWIYRQISTNDLFDRLNQMNDSETEPFQIDEEKEIDYNLIKEKLSPYFNDNFFQKNSVLQRNKALPLFYAPNSTLIDFILRSSISRLYSPYLLSFIFKGQNTIEISTKKICRSCLFYIVEIDIIKSTITIKENENNQGAATQLNLKVTPTVFIKKYKEKYQYATNISISSNGIFIAIDYSYGLTEIHRIISKKKNTYSSLSASQKASIMQSYCTTATPTKLKKIVRFSKEALFKSSFAPQPKIESKKEVENTQPNASTSVDCITMSHVKKSIEFFNNLNNSNSNSSSSTNFTINTNIHRKATMVNVNKSLKPTNINESKSTTTTNNSNIKIQNNDENKNKTTNVSKNIKIGNVNSKFNSNIILDESMREKRRCSRSNSAPNVNYYSNLLRSDNGDFVPDEHSCFFPNYTLISDYDMICICFYGRKLTMLSIANGCAVNQLEMPSEITAVAIDEFNSSIIVAMVKNGIQVISNSFLSQNNSTIDQHPISFSLFNKDVVTAICVVQNQNTEVMRTVICGTDTGRLLLLYYDDKGVDVRPLNSKHTKRIVKIEIHPEKKYFVSVDANNVAYVWSRAKIDRFVIELDN